jgi:mRNA-degrading endonuclease toxin of MazEF toxin-antitoxin module
MRRSSYLPGDIVLIIHKPLDDPSAIKARPALVVSSSQFNNSGLDVILVPISSTIRYGDTKQVLILTDAPRFSETGLRQSSAAKCASIFAYPKEHIRRKLGVAPQEILEQVKKLIIGFLTSD